MYEAPIRVLYADRDVDSCDLLEIMLGYQQIRVFTAHRADDAVAMARTMPFDLFLLATRFEDGSGVEICRALRALRPGTPVVFYTGDARESDALAARAAGADAYLVKPESDRVAETIIKLAKRSPAAALKSPIEAAAADPSTNSLYAG